MIKNWFLGILFTCSYLFAQAQMERTVYQSFEIDSIQMITLDIFGDFEIKAWAGNSILTETNVQIWNASPKILDYFIKEGRYAIVADTVQEKSVLLASKYKERKPIKTKEGECTELIRALIFVPDTFEWIADDIKTLRKKPGN